MKIVGKILTLVIVLAALGAGVYLVMKNQETRRGAAAITPSLIFQSPKNEGLAVGEQFTINLAVDTKSSSMKVSAFEVHLAFDNTKIRIDEATPSWYSWDSASLYSRQTSFFKHLEGDDLSDLSKPADLKGRFEINNDTGVLTLSGISTRGNDDLCSGVVQTYKIKGTILAEGQSKFTLTGTLNNAAITEISSSGAGQPETIAIDPAVEFFVSTGSSNVSPEESSPTPTPSGVIDGNDMTSTPGDEPEATATPTSPAATATPTKPAATATPTSGISDSCSSDNDCGNNESCGNDGTCSALSCQDNSGVDMTCKNLVTAAHECSVVTNKNDGVSCGSGKVCTAGECISSGSVGILNFKMAFAGVSAKSKCATDWKVKAIVRDANGTMKTYEDVVLSLDESSAAKNIYKGSIALEGISSQSGLSVFLKGPKHIQVKYGEDSQSEMYNREGGNLSVTTDINTSKWYDFSNYAMGPGDVNQDGVVNALDFSIVKSKSLSHEVVSEGVYLEEDLDGNCIMNTNDVLLLRETLKDKQDQIY